MSRNTDERLQIPGVRQTKSGYEVARMVRGSRKSKSFPADVTAAELRAAREAMDDGQTTPVKQSIAMSAMEYLKTITTKPTYAQVARHLELAIAFLGRDRAIGSITPTNIDELIDHWKQTAPLFGHHTRKQAVKGRTLDDETIRKRLGNLQRFFSAKLAAGAGNPVADCHERPAPKPPAEHGIPMLDVAKIIDAMPDYNRGRTSLSKVRARVMAFTGLDPAEIKRMKPTDLSVNGPGKPTMKYARMKGKKTAITTKRLTPAGADALRRFVAAGAWGEYNHSCVWDAIRRAAVTVGYPLGTFRPKDFRHSFLTEICRLTNGNEAIVARFAGHAPGSRMTHRYTLAMHEQIDQDVADRFVVPSLPQPATVLRMAKTKGRKS